MMLWAVFDQWSVEKDPVSPWLPTEDAAIEWFRAHLVPTHDLDGEPEPPSEHWEPWELSYEVDSNE